MPPKPVMIDDRAASVRSPKYLADQARSFNDSGMTIPDALPESPFVVYDPSFLQVIGESPSVSVIAEKSYSFAHEAGVYEPDGDRVWITSNLLPQVENQDSTSQPHAQLTEGKPEHAPLRVEVTTVGLTSGVAEVLDLPNVRLANGGCPFGKYLLFCDQGHGYQHPSQLVIVDPKRPSATKVLINNFHGRPFNSLNDVVVLPPPAGYRSTTTSNSAPSPSEGSGLPSGSTVWFTDPPYGHEQGFKPSPALPPHIYCFDPETGVIRVVADGFRHPNGIAFSPDGRVCYVSDTSHIHGTGERFPDRQATIYAFDVVWPSPALEAGIVAPYLSNRRVFAFADNFVPDGIKCDTLGNVYAGCGDGLHVWNQYGILIGRIILGAADNQPNVGCANFCFAPGGRIACFSEDRVYLVQGLKIEGALRTMGSE